MKAAVLLTLAAAALMTAPVSAEIFNEGAGFSSDRRMDSTESWDAIRAFGSCVARQKPEQAAALVETAPGSEDEAHLMHLMFLNSHQSCMRDAVSMLAPRNTLRGAIAEGVFKEKLRLGGADVAPPAWKERTVKSLEDFASCYVSTHLSDVKALAMTSQASTPGERIKIRSMAADFGPCMPQGIEVRLKPTELRYLFIAAALRKAAPVGVLQTGK